MPRGPQRFFYTYADLADISGWTLGQVMRSKRAGLFDPHSLVTVLAWVMAARAGEVKPRRPRYGKERRA